MIIYELYLTSDRDVDILCKRPALLDVSRQIDDEAYPVFLNRNTFSHTVVFGHANHERFLGFLRTLSRNLAAHFVNIKLFLGMDWLHVEDVDGQMHDLNRLVHALKDSHLTSEQLQIDCGQEHLSVINLDFHKLGQRHHHLEWATSKHEYVRYVLSPLLEGYGFLALAGLEAIWAEKCLQVTPGPIRAQTAYCSPAKI